MPVRLLSIFSLAAFAALLSACAGGTSTPVVPVAQPAFAPSLSFDAVPPKCAGQKTTAKFATVTATLSTHGGVFCVPAFAGFGGSIEYPAAKPAVKVTITTSTTNYNGTLKSLGKGKPLLYVQIALAGSTSFGTHQPAGGGLASKVFKSGSSYSAYGAVISPIFQKFPNSCTAVATASKFGGQIGGLGTILKGQTVPLPLTGVVEIYAGAGGTGAC